ncbi:MAG TPA: hypothetical protein VHU15_07535 [Stellaceae bacterium]|nr:hypothetical protein [Stellaceae bacterium]
MIRLASLFWLALVLVSGFAMFKVKYGVQELEDELGRMRKQTIAEQQEIRVLNAEWSYLTQPQRLAELNRRFLSLAPIPVKQLQRGVDDIPLRPPPTPALPPMEGATAPSGPEPAILAAAPAAPLPAPDTIAAAPQPPSAPVTTVALRTAAPVQLAKASPSRAPRTLDDLFAEIGGDR